ncbi:hypothetical protein A3Q56_05468 [Intoshia linei]|uniref:Uncharacterized protein n=1 Tax=Intoshia linei TaxID=1819745 RepID=A0A177AXU4_9BILA|nr:hypothetical protein A3Q56_05468 [Intoshia linei]
MKIANEIDWKRLINEIIGELSYKELYKLITPQIKDHVFKLLNHSYTVGYRKVLKKIDTSNLDISILTNKVSSNVKADIMLIVNDIIQKSKLHEESHHIIIDKKKLALSLWRRLGDKEKWKLMDMTSHIAAKKTGIPKQILTAGSSYVMEVEKIHSGKPNKVAEGIGKILLKVNPIGAIVNLFHPF